MSLAAPSASRVALYLDTPLSRDLMAQVLEHCRTMKASLLCLAPPPRHLAVSRLEPHLGALAETQIEWDIQGIENDQANPFRDLEGIALLVCDGASALARYHGALPAPLRVLLNPETRIAHNPLRPEITVDWLAPRFNRGF